MLLGKCYIHMQKNKARPLSYPTHKILTQIALKTKYKAWNQKTLRRKHRKSSLTLILAVISRISYQSTGNKSKTKQMGLYQIASAHHRKQSISWRENIQNAVLKSAGKSMAVLQNIKNWTTVWLIYQPLSWVYSQKKWKQHREEISALPHSFRHY